MQVIKAFQIDHELNYLHNKMRFLMIIFAMSVCTWISGGVRGFQLLALSWWSSSNFRLMFSMDSWSISQKPARSWEMGRGCAFGFWHTRRQAYKHTLFICFITEFWSFILSGSSFGIWMVQSLSDLGENLACVVVNDFDFVNIHFESNTNQFASRLHNHFILAMWWTK